MSILAPRRFGIAPHGRGTYREATRASMFWAEWAAAGIQIDPVTWYTNPNSTPVTNIGIIVASEKCARAKSVALAPIPTVQPVPRRESRKQKTLKNTSSTNGTHTPTARMDTSMTAPFPASSTGGGSGNQRVESQAGYGGGIHRGESQASEQRRRRQRERPPSSWQPYSDRAPGQPVLLDRRQPDRQDQDALGYRGQPPNQCRVRVIAAGAGHSAQRQQKYAEGAHADGGGQNNVADAPADLAVFLLASHSEPPRAPVSC